MLVAEVSRIFPHCFSESAERAEYDLTVIELINRCDSLLYLFPVLRTSCLLQVIPYLYEKHLVIITLDIVKCNIANDKVLIRFISESEIVMVQSELTLNDPDSAHSSEESRKKTLVYISSASE